MGGDGVLTGAENGCCCDIGAILEKSRLNKSTGAEVAVLSEDLLFETGLAKSANISSTSLFFGGSVAARAIVGLEKSPNRSSSSAGGALERTAAFGGGAACCVAGSALGAAAGIAPGVPFQRPSS